HRVDNIGHNVGPSLATSQGHTAESLLTQIIDPNRRVLPNHLNYTLVTKTGRILSGIIAEETPTSVTLRRAQGVAETVLRSSIASLTSSGRSLMPDGLEKEIDPKRWPI
ncbi:MAG: dehydrogenase, partial [Planctomycetes bacterium]|nr:dehydrogenase [Planctomycetota bacterium]